MHTFLESYCNYEPKMPNILYHYCSVDTMLKILQNYCIWLSDAEKMNDKTELRYFCVQMKKMFSDVFESYKGKYDSTLLTLVESILEKATESIYMGSAYVVQNTKNYLCCFSENADLLSQWRAYSSDGEGVAIGFNARLLSQVSDMYHFDFIKVIYDNVKIKKNIREYMEDTVQGILKNISDKELNPEELMFSLAPIMTPILQERFAFKHPGFKEEREWRLYRKQVGNFDEDDGIEEPYFEGAFHINSELKGSFSCSDLKFRSLQNDICSYYEFGFEKCKNNIIRKIILGPKCQINDKDLKILLRKYMYISDVDSNSIKIQRSKIPYV